MTRQLTVLLCAFALLVTARPCGAAGPVPQSAGPFAVGRVVDETGQGLDDNTLDRLRDAFRYELEREGVSVVEGLFSSPVMEAHPRLLHCDAAADGQACFGSVAVIVRESGRTSFEEVARSDGGGLTRLGEVMGQAVGRALRPPVGTGGAGQRITATGAEVRHLGNGRFAVSGRIVDLQSIAHGHDPVADADVPVTTNVTLNDTVPARTDARGRAHAVITLYQVDPPLTGLPSREAGIDRGTDLRDPADLVKAAYSNYVSPVLTDDPVPVRVASHPIGHFFVKVEVPGYPTLLTGMTTIARADRELVDLTIGRRLGIGGVLLTPQPGRLNSAAEVARELALRQRRLRVVDGLYFHRVDGRNNGPESLFDDGRLVFARVRMPVTNATDALAYFVEFIDRGEHNRFGSLSNGPFKGTGAGCAAFAMSWLQAAGVIPFIAEAPTRPAPAAGEELGPTEFWRAVRAGLHIPWRLVGCDERVGASRVSPAELTIYDLLFHGETTAFIERASEGLAERIRASYGGVPATLFQIGALSPLRDLVINARRNDPGDHADYTWSGPGIDIAYWDNSRFSAWIHRLWAVGPRNPGITLAREGRFMGVEIDATAAPRQREPLFATAHRQSARRTLPMPPVSSCQEVFDQGRE